MAFKGIVLRTPLLHVEGMALFPFILVRKRTLPSSLLNHERIHLRQQLELGIIPFYAFYLLEYCIRLIIHSNHTAAYLNISFEQEAYQNQHNPDYLKRRKWFSFLKYLRKQPIPPL